MIEYDLVQMTRMTSGRNETTWPLLKTVFESILEVVILCFAGWILARRDLLDKKTQKKLNVLNINLFTPALLFSKVAFFLSPSKLKELWIIPFIFVITTVTSMIVSWGVARACRLKRSQTAFAMAAAMFMNSNSLPIALMQSLVVTVHGLKWGKDDTRDGMLGRALTYLVLHSTFGMMLRWSYGVKLLAQADDEVVPAPEVQPPPTSPRTNGTHPSHVKRISSEREPLLAHSSQNLNYSSATLRSQPSIAHTNASDEIEGNSRPATPTFITDIPPERPVTVTNANLTAGHLGLPDQLRAPSRPPMVNKRSHFFYSFPNTPQLSHTSLAPSQSPPPEDLPEPVTQEMAPASSGAQAKESFTASAKARWAKFVKGFKEFMTPPLYAALLSLIVACIPPLQHVLDVHMLPVKGAISSAGNCSIPITLVVLGGYFWRGDEGKETGTAPEGVRTDLPQQRLTGVPDLPPRSKTRKDSRAVESRLNGDRILSNSEVTAEPAGMEDDDRRAGVSRPVSDATLIGTASTTATATPSWKRSWLSLKGRSRKYARLPDDEEQVQTQPTEPNPSSTIPQPVSTSSGQHTGEGRTVLVAILSRMIFTPLILLPIMAVVMSQTTMRLFDEVLIQFSPLPSPVFVVSNVLFISSPPALTLAQITQAASGDAFERLISKTIFWSYCIVTPITTILYVFIGLELSRL
ncbi:hypothetical protein CPB86DRAFT_812358 [Serendipita vermifera]|nr:hypothetical protein CPB86DRAFT_812358 [Serendipita vermifera]